MVHGFKNYQQCRNLVGATGAPAQGSACRGPWKNTQKLEEKIHSNNGQKINCLILNNIHNKIKLLKNYTICFLNNNINRRDSSGGMIKNIYFKNRDSNLASSTGFFKI